MGIHKFPGDSSGGGLPVNSIAPLKEVDDLVVASDNSVWLRSGVVEDDPTVYPLAYAEGILDVSEIYGEGTAGIPNSSHAFKPDGTVLYVLANGDVYTYSLSTAWDVNTATRVFGLFDVSTQDTSTASLRFSSDGTSFFILGTNNDTVYQYDLSTAWDVSTATASNSKLVGTQDTSPKGVAFKTDGTKMYMVGQQYDAVYQYNLSTAWDVSTAVYGSSTSVSAYDAAPKAIAFNTDGTKMYVLGDTGNDLNEFTLSTAWDVTTKVYVGKTASITTSPLDVSFSSDGTAFYIAGNNSIGTYSMSTAWDITDISSLTVEFDISSETGNPTAYAMSSDGTKMYVGAFNKVYVYSLTTPYDITTASYDYPFTPEVSGDVLQITFSVDGTFVSLLQGTNVYGYKVYDPWVLNTAEYLGTFSLSTQDATPLGIAFSCDGLRMYMSGGTNDTLYQYDLSIAWDVTTAAVKSGTVSLGVNIENIRISNLGDVIIGINTVNLCRIDLPTPWNLTGGVYNGEQTPFPSVPVLSVKGFDLVDKHSKVIVVDASTDNVITFNLPKYVGIPQCTFDEASKYSIYVKVA